MKKNDISENIINTVCPDIKEKDKEEIAKILEKDLEIADMDFSILLIKCLCESLKADFELDKKTLQDEFLNFIVDNPKKAIFTLVERLSNK
jgi:hypothetical protein